MIYCLKANLHCHTDELAGGSHRWHSSSYPVAEVLALFERKGFDVLAITEHISDASVASNALAARLVAEGRSSLMLLPGREQPSEEGFHVVELFDGDSLILKFLCHPIRTNPEGNLLEIANRMREAYEIEAVELDMCVAQDSSLLRRYEELRRETGLPVISNSDFHGDLFTVPNHFTVFLCKERSPRAILEAIGRGNFVAFYPDLSSWELRAWPGDSELSREWMEGQRPERFSRRFEEFLQIDPPVRIGQMSREQIEAFHGCGSVLLEEGDLAVMILPERGGRIAGIWLNGVQIADPILNAGLDVDSSAEAFEAGFAPFEVLAQRRSEIILHRVMVNHPEFAGVVYQKRYRLADGKIYMTSSRLNCSGRDVRLKDHLRYRFFKEFGEDVRVSVESPERRELTIPVNYLGPCWGSCRFTVEGERYALTLHTEDERLESLSLWSRHNNPYALAILSYKGRVLTPGQNVPDYKVVLEPRLRK